MARKRKVDPEPVLGSWMEVDQALGEIRKLSGDQATDQTALDERVREAQAFYAEAMQSRAQRIARLEKDIEEYAVKHKAELEATEKRRSMALPNGTISFRRSCELAAAAGLTWKRVVEYLEGMGKRGAAYLRTQVTVNKDAVRDAKLDETKLDKLNMRMVVKDTFAYDLNQDTTAATVPIDGAAGKDARRAG